MNVVVAIGGLAFLILVHEAGHFFTALAVRMRPRKFYLFFPPALVKWRRSGIEYGIGAIPLGGYVKIPGMHKPAAGDLRHHLEPAARGGALPRRRGVPVEQALVAEDFGEARTALADLRVRVESKDLSDGARRAAEPRARRARRRALAGRLLAGADLEADRRHPGRAGDELPLRGRCSDGRLHGGDPHGATRTVEQVTRGHAGGRHGPPAG